MSEYLHKNVGVVVKHVSDYSMETGPDGNKVQLELPGHVEIGVVVDGAFIPLAKMGKARFDKKVAMAKSAKPTSGKQ